MEQPKITCYLKPTCGWSEGVRAVLRKHGLEWEEKDTINRFRSLWQSSLELSEKLKRDYDEKNKEV